MCSDYVVCCGAALVDAIHAPRRAQVCCVILCECVDNCQTGQLRLTSISMEVAAVVPVSWV